MVTPDSGAYPVTTQSPLWREEPRPFELLEKMAQDIVHDAGFMYRTAKAFALFSGGNDSLVLLDMATRYGWAEDGVIHVNTGTGIPDTTEFVRQTCADWNLPLHELHPPQSYEQVFLRKPIIDGLPGPGMHHIAYGRLKERALRAFVKSQKEHRLDKILFLTGIRADESVKRMGYTDSVIDREGAVVWANPLYRWTNAEMAAYKAARGLPKNPVSEHLHFSGECLCGAYARPDELAELDFFYPEVAERIRGWEREAAERGLTYCKWGERRPGGREEKVGRLCSNCPSLFPDEEVEHVA